MVIKIPYGTSKKQVVGTELMVSKYVFFFLIFVVFLSGWSRIKSRYVVQLIDTVTVPGEAIINLKQSSSKYVYEDDEYEDGYGSGRLDFNKMNPND